LRRKNSPKVEGTGKITNRSGNRIYILAALVIALGFSVYTATRPIHEFPSNKPGKDAIILVSDGETGSSIAHDLQRLGVIKESVRFIELAYKDRRSVGISPGSHRISTHITSLQALEQLLDRQRFTHLVDVVEGSTVSDVMKRISQDPNVIGSSSRNLKGIKPPLGSPGNILEGQLFPASYSFAAGTTYSQALQTMLNKFEEQIGASGLKQGYSKFTPYQVLTIASMIQIEGDPSDYQKVAGVIYNRLRIGMALQLNSTVQYAAGLRGKISLSTAATKIDSRYNTYKYAGLPPTPISNPGLLAIRAALHPATHDYLYFITVKPHDTRFTKDYTQFENWVTEYNKNRAAGLFK